MRSLIPLSLVLILLDLHSVDAVILPFIGRQFNSYSKRYLNARASTSGTVSINNLGNIDYTTNVTLGGQTFTVLLDTGSSDLWVAATSVPSAQDTGKTVSLSYAEGEAAGDIYTATLGFDNYTVENQAFALVTNSSSYSTDMSSSGYVGILGLGPNKGSLISSQIGDSSGDNMLNRIFQQNETSNNYITFLLSRANDAGDPYTGQFTIAEVAPSFENITSMPKIAVETVSHISSSNQHWQLLTDVNGVIGPDGQPIEVKSIVPKAPDGQLVAVLDTGFTLPQVPRAMSDAIYGRVQGAQWNADDLVWEIPCAQMLNISFKFGGVTYPVHPLDTSSGDLSVPAASDGTPMCVGAFQPITTAFSLYGEYDMILGMGFLRNAYTLLDFGTWVESTSNDQGSPYIQMLPITDVNAAHQDFVNERLNGKDTTGSPQYALLPTSEMQHSPETAAEKKAAEEEIVLSRLPEILVGSIIFLLLLLGLCIWCCCRRRSKKAKKSKKGSRTVLPPVFTGDTAYQPLPSPAPSMRMHPMSGTYDRQSGYDPRQSGYDSRGASHYSNSPPAYGP